MAQTLLLLLHAAAAASVYESEKWEPIRFPLHFRCVEISCETLMHFVASFRQASTVENDVCERRGGNGGADSRMGQLQNWHVRLRPQTRVLSHETHVHPPRYLILHAESAGFKEFK